MGACTGGPRCSRAAGVLLAALLLLSTSCCHVRAMVILQASRLRAQLSSRVGCPSRLSSSSTQPLPSLPARQELPPDTPAAQAQCRRDQRVGCRRQALPPLGRRPSPLSAPPLPSSFLQPTDRQLHGRIPRPARRLWPRHPRAGPQRPAGGAPIARADAHDRGGVLGRALSTHPFCSPPLRTQLADPLDGCDPLTPPPALEAAAARHRAQWGGGSAAALHAHGGGERAPWVALIARTQDKAGCTFDVKACGGGRGCCRCPPCGVCLAAMPRSQRLRERLASTPCLGCCCAGVQRSSCGRRGCNNLRRCVSRPLSSTAQHSTAAGTAPAAARRARGRGAGLPPRAARRALSLTARAAPPPLLPSAHSFEALILMAKDPRHPDPPIPAAFVSQRSGAMMRQLMVEGRTVRGREAGRERAWLSGGSWAMSGALVGRARLLSPPGLT